MAVSLHAEQLDHINVLRVTIYGEPACVLDHSLHLKDKRLWLGQRQLIDFGALDFEVSAPSVEDIERLSREEDAELETLQVKLHIRRPLSRQTTAGSSNGWWASPDLRSMDALMCRGCSTPVVQPEALKKLMDLPSEHYYEMMDCWICHETKPEEHRPRMQPISARKDTLLVSATYFMAHHDNILSVAMDSEVASKTDWTRGTMTKWILVNCEQCGTPIGEGHYCQTDEVVTLMQAKLFKYCLDIHPTPKDSPGFMDILVCDLVDSIQAHAISYFMIQGRQSTKVYALMWIFNPNMTIMRHKDVDSSDVGLTRERVMKVLYMTDETTLDERLDAWPNSNQADHLLYPDGACQQLRSALEASTLLLPPPLRTMNHPAMPLTRDFTVGYIPIRLGNPPSTFA